MKQTNLPATFLWGASTSAYQFEGAWNVDDKRASIQDAKPGQPFKDGADHFHRWQEDVQLMAQMGLKSYRFSIAWTRVMNEGKPNPKGLHFYQQLIDELLKYKIEPIVTIYHNDLPLSLAQQGGWANRQLVIPQFVNYAKLLFKTFGTKVKWWQTINEQNTYILRKKDLHEEKQSQVEVWRARFQENHHMLVASALVIELFHQLVPNGKIGPAPELRAVYGTDDQTVEQANAWYNWTYLDPLIKGEYPSTIWQWFKKMHLLPEFHRDDLALFSRIKDQVDFIAFNYWTSTTVKQPAKVVNLMNAQPSNVPFLFDVANNDHLVQTKFGYAMDPNGLVQVSQELHDRYHLPIIITENGLGAKDKLVGDKVHDDYRIAYLKAHIELIPQILTQGINLLGYHAWSAIDLLSTSEGMTKRYGFVFVDRDDAGNGDFKRYLKDSFYWYKKVIASNGENLD